MLKIQMLRRVVGGTAVLALIGAGLTACGGSSDGASRTSASAARPSSTATALPSARGGSTTASNGRSTTASSPRHLPGARVAQPRPIPAPAIQRTAFRNALTHFASCLRQNGVKLPASSAPGKGPLLSTKGVNTNSPQYKAAIAKCRSVLMTAFRQAARSARPRRG